MAAVERTADPVPLVRRVVDSRPPSRCWTPVLLTSVGSPEPGAGPPDDQHTLRTRPDPRRVRRSLVPLPGAARPDPTLPDPQEWAALLSVAVLQVLTGRRPAAQLDWWLGAGALLEVKHQAARRRHPSAVGSRGGNASVVSVRVQCLSSRAVEVAAHLRLGARSVAMALRLEGYGERWRCTAIELGPRCGD